MPAARTELLRRTAVVVLALDAIGALLLALSGAPAMESIVVGDSAGPGRWLTVGIPFLFASGAALWCPAAATLAFVASGRRVQRTVTVTLGVMARGAVVATALSVLMFDLPWVGAAALLAFVLNASTASAIRRGKKPHPAPAPDHDAINLDRSNTA